MGIEKLIDDYRKAADKWEKRNPVTDTFDLRVQDALREAATALSTLQAENEKLRNEVERQRRSADDRKHLYENAERAYMKVVAELEQVKRDRDAAVSDIETALAYGMKDCELCKNSQCYVRGGTKPCLPKWRGIQKDSSPYLVEDEATEFTKEQWDWLLRRFTKKED